MCDCLSKRELVLFPIAFVVMAAVALMPVLTDLGNKMNKDELRREFEVGKGRYMFVMSPQEMDEADYIENYDENAIEYFEKHKKSVLEVYDRTVEFDSQYSSARSLPIGFKWDESKDRFKMRRGASE